MRWKLSLSSFKRTGPRRLKHIEPELWLELAGLVLFAVNAPIDSVVLECIALGVLLISTLMDMFG